MATPRPVASLRPNDPPRGIGLPVTISMTDLPSSIVTVSAIQAIVWALVLTSGAGISRLGPRMGRMAVVKRRVRRHSSFCDITEGSQSTPPLAPP